LIEVVHKVVDLLADHYTRVSRPASTSSCTHNIFVVQRVLTALASAMMTTMVMLIYVI